MKSVSRIFLALVLVVGAQPLLAAQGGSCHYSEQAFCINYIGKLWNSQRDQAKSDCESDQGTYSKRACTTAQRFGKCVVTLMKDFEMEAVFYPPNNNETAREACDSLGGEYSIVD